MKIFLSYKQTGVNRDELNKRLNIIKNIVEKSGNSIYIYYFDNKQKKESKYIIKKVKEKISQSDLVIGFIDFQSKSEGELLELGIAEGMNKDILLLINGKFKKDYFLVYGLNSKVIYYKNLKEIELLLSNYLKGK